MRVLWLLNMPFQGCHRVHSLSFMFVSPLPTPTPKRLEHSLKKGCGSGITFHLQGITWRTWSAGLSWAQRNQRTPCRTWPWIEKCWALVSVPANPPASFSTSVLTPRTTWQCSWTPPVSALFLMSEDAHWSFTSASFPNLKPQGKRECVTKLG